MSNNVLSLLRRIRDGPFFKVESRITGKVLCLDSRELKELNRLLKSKVSRSQAVLTLLDPPEKNSVWVDVFRKIITKRPDLKVPLGLKYCYDDTLIDDFKFCWHCRNFGGFWMKVTEVILSSRHRHYWKDSDYAYDQMAEIIHSTGRRHSYGIGVTFDAEAWLLFKSALLECFEGKRVWNKVVSFVIAEMKRIFLSTTEKRHSFASSSSIIVNPIKLDRKRSSSLFD